MDRNELSEALKQNVATIVFVTKAGTERTIRCTLMGEAITPYERKTETRQKAFVENIMSVWDLENDGWRSVNLDTIKSVEYEPARR